MKFWSKFFYRYRRVLKALRLFFLIAGPGIIVMVADNDAGGITTYAATGAKFGYGFILFLIILGPIAYVVQEMTVRLGAITKRGHAEAIFDAFGSFWGWFSLGRPVADRPAYDRYRVYRNDGGRQYFRHFSLYNRSYRHHCNHGHESFRPILDVGKARPVVLRVQSGCRSGRHHHSSLMVVNTEEWNYAGIARRGLMARYSSSSWPISGLPSRPGCYFSSRAP